MDTDTKGSSGKCDWGIFQFLRSVFFVVLSFCMFWVSSTAQNIKEIEGNLTLENGISGKAKYSIIELKGKKFFHGPFSMHQSFEDSLDIEQVNNLLYQGTYFEGKKSGLWFYEYDRLKARGKPYVEDLLIVQPGSGMRKVIKAQFSNGLADGLWEVNRKSVSVAQDVDSLYISRASFSNNTFSGPFHSWTDSLIINGMINDKGYLDGLWMFDHGKIQGKALRESRLYVNGILKEHRFLHGVQIHEVHYVGLDQTYDSIQENWVQIPVSKSYFDLIKETAFGVKKSTDFEVVNSAISKSNALLNYSINSYGFHLDAAIWKLQAEDPQLIHPKVNVRKYNYTETDVSLIQSSYTRAEQCEQLIERFLKDPQAILSKEQNRKVAFHHVVLNVYLSQLIKIKHVLNKLGLPEFTYINRSEIIPQLLGSSIEYPDLLPYNFQDKQFKDSFNFPADLLQENANIELLSEQVIAILESVNIALSEVIPIVEYNRKRSGISHFEHSLVEIKDSIVLLFSNELSSETYNSYHLRFKNEVLNYVNQRFKDYAAKDLEVRLTEIEELLICFQQFILLYEKMIDLQLRISKIQEEYTRIIWNPFTFTDMEEIVKERVFYAYKNRLLPYVLDGMEGSFSCEKVNTIMRNFDLLCAKTIELRDNDTKELERNLRRMHDVQKTIELFELRFE